MKNHYIIKVSLSRILRNCDESTFTMFVDGSKISIVYELTEWIRWLFSLQECFYLTHENSVIHDFEDIRILSGVKELIVKPCQSKCFHKGSHKILFSRIDLFAQWDNIKVPKIFLEKINEKITQTDGLAIIKPVSVKSKKKSKTPECVSGNEEEIVSNDLVESGKTDGNVNKNISVKAVSDQKNKSTDSEKSKNCGTSTGNDVPKSKKSKENLLEKKVSDIDLVKNQSNTAEKLPNQNTNPSESLDKTQIPPEGKLKIEPMTTSPAKHTEIFKFSPKPFCIGDLLSNLREEIKQEESSKNIFKENVDTKFTNTENAITADCDSGEPKKKKKRKRSRSKKKLISELGNLCATDVTTPSSLGDPRSYFEDKKPNHIRFDFDDENEFMEMDLPPGQENKDISKFTCSSNIQRRCCSNLISTNLDEIKAMINEKKHMLTNHEDYYPYCEYGEKNSSTQTSNGIVTKEDNIIIFEQQSASKFKRSESSFADDDLKTLTQLKEKFPCPVVIERFY